MNKQDIQTSVYAQKVDLLIRLLPLVMEEKVFAVHGGTAINLFLRNLPRPIRCKVHDNSAEGLP